MGRDGIAGLICLALSTILLVLTRGLPHSSFVPVGPEFYPRIVLALMAVLSVALIVEDALSRRRSRNAAGGAAAPAPEQRNYSLVTATFAVFAGYVFLLPLLGYRVATFVFVAALQAVLDPPHGWRRWLYVAVTALVTVVITYLAFETYLSVLLPRGRWLDW